MSKAPKIIPGMAIRRDLVHALTKKVTRSYKRMRARFAYFVVLRKALKVSNELAKNTMAPIAALAAAREQVPVNA